MEEFANWTSFAASYFKKCIGWQLFFKKILWGLLIQEQEN
jgi:hypothetical protein